MPGFHANNALGCAVILACHQAGLVEVPSEWSATNIAFVSVGALICVLNYFNEYLQKDPLSYSKFAKTEHKSKLDSRLGWLIAYGMPLVSYAALSKFHAMPDSPYHNLCYWVYVGHFAKRCFEAVAVHRYSSNWDLAPAIQIGVFYSVGTGIAHYWANVATSREMGATEAFRAQANLGLAIFVIGELINLYHHHALAQLRSGGKKGYLVPEAGLSPLVTCPHYFGELVAWFGLAVVGRHLMHYVSWLTMVVYLGARSYHTREWYLKKVEGFPKTRKCLTPFFF